MTLLLIDSASLWYRAYYGMPDTLVSPQGSPREVDLKMSLGYREATRYLVEHFPGKLVGREER